MLSIGRLAEFAQVSVRTVHHYHRIGLLPEPPREPNGYRRYRSADLIRLLRIRTLAELGIPLHRIGDLLDGPPETLRQAIDDLDEQLRLRQERIAAQRAALAAARDHDPRHPPTLARMVAQLGEAGVSRASVDAERDAVLLAQALGGDPAPAFDQLADERWASLWREFDDIRELDPDDPRVAEVVERTEAVLREVGPGMAAADPGPPDELAALLLEDFIDSLPAAHAAVIRSVSARLTAAGRPAGAAQERAADR